MLSLIKQPSNTAKVPLHDPNTHKAIGTLIVAGPDHEATKEWQREINGRRQKRTYRPDAQSETREALCRRTIGWEGVKDTDTGQDAPFDPSALPALYEQEWLLTQVLEAIGEEDFFFKE